MGRKFRLSQRKGYQTSPPKQQPPVDISKELLEDPSLNTSFQSVAVQTDISCFDEASPIAISSGLKFLSTLLPLMSHLPISLGLSCLNEASNAASSFESTSGQLSLSSQLLPLYTTTTEQPPTKHLLMEQPSTEQPSTEQPSTVQPSMEQPSTEQPSTDQPSTELPSTEQPSTEQPSTDQPSTELPSTEQSSTEQPSMEQPSMDQPSTELPSTEQPYTEVPIENSPSPSLVSLCTEMPESPEPTLLDSQYLLERQSTPTPNQTSANPVSLFGCLQQPYYEGYSGQSLPSVEQYSANPVNVFGYLQHPLCEGNCDHEFLPLVEKYKGRFKNNSGIFVLYLCINNSCLECTYRNKHCGVL